MLKNKGPSKDPCGTALIISCQKLFLFFVYGERDNQKLIKVPHCQYHMHSI